MTPLFFAYLAVLGELQTLPMQSVPKGFLRTDGVRCRLLSKVISR